MGSVAATGVYRQGRATDVTMEAPTGVGGGWKAAIDRPGVGVIEAGEQANGTAIG